VERLAPRGSLPGAVTDSVASKLLDPHAILRACDGHASLLDRIREVFRETLPDELARVRAALGDCNFERLREAVHGLAGTVGLFSTVTADIALTLEDEAAHENFERCSALLERLTSMCHALLEETAAITIDSLRL